MLTSEKLAIAAHLHVLLRRKTGRVTDTEWMATNLEYGLEIVRFTRVKAEQDGHDDLNDWADKLERALLDPVKPTTKPLAQSAMQLLRERAQAPAVPTTPAVRTPTQAPPRSAPAPLTSGFLDSLFGDTGFADSSSDPSSPRKSNDPNAPRYVGGIR